MKKFNTRRRLTGAILNAASSPRWALLGNDAFSDVDQFSDFNSDENTSKGEWSKLFDNFLNLKLFADIIRGVIWKWKKKKCHDRKLQIIRKIF